MVVFVFHFMISYTMLVSIVISIKQQEDADRAEAKKAANDARLEKAALEKAEIAARKEAAGEKT